ncbi:MAG: hypothetical protein Q9222_002700 [Ikaeria aurantiellina]
MHDPPLTTLGEQQCQNLAARFPYHSSLGLIVASPLRRTLQTALLAFKNPSSNNIPFIALPEIQETSDLPCDTGSNIFILKEEFKNKPVDLSLLPEDWDSKQGKWAADRKVIEQRCREARKWLKARQERDIVIITHGGLLHYLTEDWTGAAKFQVIALQGTGWENTEFRSFHFVEGDDENAAIQETRESKGRRGGGEKPLSKEEKTQLKETAARDWEEQGYEVASKV